PAREELIERADSPEDVPQRGGERSAQIEGVLRVPDAGEVRQGGVPGTRGFAHAVGADVALGTVAPGCRIADDGDGEEDSVARARGERAGLESGLHAAGQEEGLRFARRVGGGAGGPGSA